MAPHLAEEIWSHLGGSGLIALAPWPKANEALFTEEILTIPIQINGKRKAEIKISKDSTKEEVERLALSEHAVLKVLGQTLPKKVIYIPGRIINVVI
jgi:leucyl-tRNA synthetase